MKTGGIMMYCPKCGAIIPDESSFCPKCGAAVQPPAEPKKFSYNLLSIIGFSLSILALLWLGGIVGTAAIILSVIGFIQCKKNCEKGKEFAVAGIVIGAVSTVYMLLVLLSASSLIQTFTQLAVAA